MKTIETSGLSDPTNWNVDESIKAIAVESPQMALEMARRWNEYPELARLSHQFRNERDAYKRDAERYRWARQQPADVLLDLYCLIPGDETPEGFDAATDAAMKGKA